MSHRRERNRKIVQIEGIEKLETRITPVAPFWASKIGYIASTFATSDGGIGQYNGGSVGGTVHGQGVSVEAKVHFEPNPAGRGPGVYD